MGIYYCSEISFSVSQAIASFPPSYEYVKTLRKKMSSEQKKTEMSLLPNFISTRAHWRWRCSGTKTKNDPFVEPFFWHQNFWRLQKRFFVAKSKKKEYMSTKKAYANVNLKSCHSKVSWCISFLQPKKKKSSPKPKDSLLKKWHL